MQKTEISYLELTWNPLAMKCTPVSPACDKCWHRRMANRHARNPNFSDEVRAAYAGETGPVLVESRLNEPARRKKPAVIGVQFMGDLFHEDVPFPHISRIFETMSKCNHTFLVLTKRPSIMLEWQIWSGWRLPNVWLGVTAENQATANERIPLLLETPAALRYVSAEPLLGEIDLGHSLGIEYDTYYKKWTVTERGCISGQWWLDLVITGGETGPGARPTNPDHFRLLRDQCQAAGVSFYFKQHGEWLHFERRGAPGNGYYHAANGERLAIADFIDKPHEIRGDFGIARIGNKRAGHLLDGVEWQQMPEGIP